MYCLFPTSEGEYIYIVLVWIILCTSWIKSGLVTPWIVLVIHVVTKFYNWSKLCPGRILLQQNIEFQLLSLEPITDPPTFTLTCVTTGGPPTTVTWTRDNTEIDYQSNTNFTFSQTVTNSVNSTYSNTLTVTGRYPGRYNMTAWNRNTVLYVDSRPATSDLLVKGKHVMVH